MSRYKNKNKAKIFSILTAALMMNAININHASSVNSAKNKDTNDKVHFLPVGSGDAILIESNGKFALVDGGEDSDNPRNLPDLEHHGYEDVVIDYIKKVAGDKNGNVVLEFVVGTHAHSDHLGGLDSVINDKQILVKKGYIKKYNPNKIIDKEVKNWDNAEVYKQTIEALHKEGAEIIQNIPKKTFKMEDLVLQFFNTEYDTSDEKKGENENSLGLKIQKSGQTIFLAGDINNLDGDEDKIAKVLGHIDLLKIGHHGYLNSNTPEYLDYIRPNYAILTNSEKGMFDTTKQNLAKHNTTIYSTMRNNGVVATFGEKDFNLSQYSSLDTDWHQDKDKWYYKQDGKRVTGWKELMWENKNGWHYFDETNKNHFMQTGWLNKDKKWYYLNEETNKQGPKGIMLKGWQYLKWNDTTNWYFFNNSGEMQTGWFSQGNKWYYLKDTSSPSKLPMGAMLTGWQELKWDNTTNWYFFNNSGEMQTGWIKDNDNWYYLRETSDKNAPRGSMVKGKHYLEYNGKKSWYYFDSKGRLR